MSAMRTPVPFWHQTLFSSGTVVATGTSATTVTPVPLGGAQIIFPTYFFVVGSSMTTDETNTVTIEWFADAAATSLKTSNASVATTTFTQMTATNLSAVEAWPGDISAMFSGAASLARDMVPAFPYFQITHTLAGTTKSMSYVVYWSGFVYA